MVVPHDFTDEKRALRSVMRLRRTEMTGSEEDHVRLQSVLFSHLSRRSAQKIACTWPLPGEIDLRPLFLPLIAAGHTILLPETTPKGTALTFRQWHSESTMHAGRFGTMHPDGPVATPDLLLVPLLAFDRSLNRLGYGGGYYDRTLALLRCDSMGFAFSWQEVASVPHDAYDWQLDCVVTEKGIFGGNRS